MSSEERSSKLRMARMRELRRSEAYGLHHMIVHRAKARSYEWRQLRSSWFTPYAMKNNELINNKKKLVLK